uniref:Ras-related protein Rab n=1 Tax=Oryctolagus cuniculus TaxID=9986 RepID=A0A5F9C1R3_RABIT
RDLSERRSPGRGGGSVLVIWSSANSTWARLASSSAPSSSSSTNRATIVGNIAWKVLNWDRLKLAPVWDVWQERFGNMTRVYYKEALGVFAVFDISRSSTFEAVLKWKSDLDSKVHLPNGSAIPAVLLANKCDRKREGGQNPPQMDQFCKEHEFIGGNPTDWRERVKKEKEGEGECKRERERQRHRQRSGDGEEERDTCSGAGPCKTFLGAWQGSRSSESH